jgi:hypothetical protein
MALRLILFIRWYFLRIPLGIIQGYAQYAGALLDIIPFGYLLRTLLSPWKNIVERTPRHGLNISLIFEAICLGLLARGVGCVVRILTIALGLMLHVLLLALTVAYLVVWILFPVITVLSVAYLLSLA